MACPPNHAPCPWRPQSLKGATEEAASPAPRVATPLRPRTGVQGLAATGSPSPRGQGHPWPSPRGTQHTIPGDGPAGPSRRLGARAPQRSRTVCCTDRPAVWHPPCGPRVLRMSAAEHKKKTRQTRGCRAGRSVLDALPCFPGPPECQAPPGTPAPPPRRIPTSRGWANGPNQQPQINSYYQGMPATSMPLGRGPNVFFSSRLSGGRSAELGRGRG